MVKQYMTLRGSSLVGTFGPRQWFCSVPGASVVTYTGTTMFQADFTAGLSFVLGGSRAR